MPGAWGCGAFINDPHRTALDFRQALETTNSGAFSDILYRPHPWRKQLSIKGRKLYAATLWRDLLANQLTPEQAADNWNLPLAAIHEAVSYCEMHQDLLALEAEEERYRLPLGGLALAKHQGL